MKEGPGFKFHLFTLVTTRQLLNISKPGFPGLLWGAGGHWVVDLEPRWTSKATQSNLFILQMGKLRLMEVVNVRDRIQTMDFSHCPILPLRNGGIKVACL